MELAYIAVLEAATERYRSSTLLSLTKIFKCAFSSAGRAGDF